MGLNAIRVAKTDRGQIDFEGGAEEDFMGEVMFALGPEWRSAREGRRSGRTGIPGEGACRSRG